MKAEKRRVVPEHEAKAPDSQESFQAPSCGILHLGDATQKNFSRLQDAPMSSAIILCWGQKKDLADRNLIPEALQKQKGLSSRGLEELPGQGFYLQALA